jgi:alanyl-tRNA synthetase
MLIFVAKVDSKLRSDTTKNHSATLDASGIENIEHVEQKGSLVSPDHLRFDFSHFAKDR